MTSLQGGVVDYLRTLHIKTTGEYAWTAQWPAQNAEKQYDPIYRPLLTDGQETVNSTGLHC